MLPYVSPYKEDGSIASVVDGSWKGDGINPLEAYKGFVMDLERTKAVGALFLELNPLKGLTVKTMVGLDGGVNHDISVSKPSYPYNNGEGSVSGRYQRNYTLTMTNTVNYLFDLKEDHHFNLLLGQEAIQSQTEQMIAGANGLSDDRVDHVEFRYHAGTSGWFQNGIFFLVFLRSTFLFLEEQVLSGFKRAYGRIFTFR